MSWSRGGERGRRTFDDGVEGLLETEDGVVVILVPGREEEKSGEDGGSARGGNDGERGRTVRTQRCWGTLVLRRVVGQAGTTGRRGRKDF